MRNSKDLFTDLRNSITVYDAGEAESVAFLVLEHVHQLSRTDILTEKKIDIDPEQEKYLHQIANRVNAHQPVQYILGSAYFFGRNFYVTPAVLIPRPETELLVDEIIKTVGNNSASILDIGTGSGCIAITLAKELAQANVTAIDISEAALTVARKNATHISAKVEFLMLDILTAEIPLHNLDLIVSNPPYIAVSEKQGMNENVLAHEPPLALFVPDNNALIFYKAIAHKGFTALKAGGKVLVEINERFGKETADVFIQAGFSTATIIKDLQGKDRIVIATKH